MLGDRLKLSPESAFDAEVHRRAPNHQVRPPEAGDNKFLFALFSAIEIERFKRLGIGDHPALAEPILQTQFAAQVQGYEWAWPRAMHRIVMYQRVPIGRMIVDWQSPDHTTGVDLSILPEARHRGTGLAMLRAWITVSAALRKPAVLHVMPDNPARKLYHYLGFREANCTDFPVKMVASVGH